MVIGIYEDYGCEPATWDTPLPHTLVHSQPLVIALDSVTHGGKVSPALSPLRRSPRALTPSSHRPCFHEEAKAVQ